MICEGSFQEVNIEEFDYVVQKLADLSTVPTARLIDGILLTKFDTIDDKVCWFLLCTGKSHSGCEIVGAHLTRTETVMQVGAALSMVYISGAPVMFVGCGQSYTDLKKLNVKSIVKTLLKWKSSVYAALLI